MTTPFDVLVEEMKREARRKLLENNTGATAFLHPDWIDATITHTAHAVREATVKEVLDVLREHAANKKRFNGRLISMIERVEILATLSTKDVTPTT